MSFYYIASPYTNKDPDVVKKRFYDVMEFTANLMKRNIAVYSPIVHCHELASTHNMPTTFEYWQKMNHAMLDASKGMVVLTLPGWENSKGVEDEIQYAKSKKLPIYFAWPESDWLELFEKNLIVANY